MRFVICLLNNHFLQCLGPAYLLTQERLELEYKAMCQYHKLRPFCVPTPVLYDKEFSTSKLILYNGQVVIYYIDDDQYCTL